MHDYINRVIVRKSLEGAERSKPASTAVDRNLRLYLMDLRRRRLVRVNGVLFARGGNFLKLYLLAPSYRASAVDEIPSSLIQKRPIHLNVAAILPVETPTGAVNPIGDLLEMCSVSLRLKRPMGPTLISSVFRPLFLAPSP